MTIHRTNEVMSGREMNHKRIVQVLADSQIPMDVENVKVQAGMKNWESTKSILLEMVLQGRISGQKTTKGWIFWVGEGSKARVRRR